MEASTRLTGQQACSGTDQGLAMVIRYAKVLAASALGLKFEDLNY
jgi:hypothetical protein